ncbi:MAG: putative ABC transporter permease YknZ [Planctomycetes bacterium ADurb.Bin126]|nr:MAG: putative ABC transporter permease YknZ [Planctomycetes bacterium ADurb.Bin126]HOD82000.1 ABC transporter permease [Phycisphaerae bacterium]HQL74851.1 ABC transporter permease [Phycisphaerae bacterium]
MKAIYKAGDIVLLGLHGVMVHKVRSALTVLGILFGVWSVIAMLAINAGASYESQMALRELGSNNIIINSVKPPTEQKASEGRSGHHGALIYGLTDNDVRRLRANIPGLQDSVVVHRAAKTATANDRRINVAVISTEPNYPRVVQTDITAGRFISSYDMLRYQPHAVLTQGLADKLFPLADPLGKTVALDGDPFIVIGIVRQLPATLAGTSQSAILIPISTDRAQFGEFNIEFSQGSITSEKVEVSQLILQMANDDGVLEGAAIARNLLRRFRESQDYDVTVPLELIEQKRKQMQLWNYMFVSIASVSLLVGGIGIMNIMLASVTERTREIGIRRALGAKRRDIVTQFLVESVTLTAIGGTLGIAIGLLVPWVVQKMLGFLTIVTPSTLFLPFIMAVVVGLVSGLYPATRAAKLDPIVALRHE